MTRHPQNDPDRAGGLITGGQGEFVAENPGGAFDPRGFRPDAGRGADSTTASKDEPDPDVEAPPTPKDEPDPDVEAPPMDDERMSGPGEEIDKAG